MDANNKDALTVFISIYKELTQLWDHTCPVYGSRKFREEGYKQFLNRFSKTCPKITIKEIKSKINTIRTNFRRELKKIKVSDNTYTSSLWYFENLRFLEPALERTESQEIKIKYDKKSFGMDTSLSSPKKRIKLNNDTDQNGGRYNCECDSDSLSPASSEKITSSMETIWKLCKCRHCSNPIISIRKSATRTSEDSIKSEVEDLPLDILSSQGDDFVQLQGLTNYNANSIDQDFEQPNINSDDDVLIIPNSPSVLDRKTQTLNNQQRQHSPPKQINIGVRRFSDFTEGRLSHYSSENVVVATSASMKEAATQCEYNEAKRRCTDRDRSIDEPDLLGQLWAQKLKKLQKDQRSLAENFIANIFMEAEFGTLRKNSVQITKE